VARVLEATLAEAEALRGGGALPAALRLFDDLGATLPAVRTRATFWLGWAATLRAGARDRRAVAALVEGVVATRAGAEAEQAAVAAELGRLACMGCEEEEGGGADEGASASASPAPAAASPAAPGAAADAAELEQAMFAGAGGVGAIACTSLLMGTPGGAPPASAVLPQPAAPCVDEGAFPSPRAPLSSSVFGGDLAIYGDLGASIVLPRALSALAPLLPPPSFSQEAAGGEWGDGEGAAPARSLCDPGFALAPPTPFFDPAVEDAEGGGGGEEEEEEEEESASREHAVPVPAVFPLPGPVQMGSAVVLAPLPSAPATLLSPVRRSVRVHRSALKSALAGPPHLPDAAPPPRAAATEARPRALARAPAPAAPSLRIENATLRAALAASAAPLAPGVDIAGLQERALEGVRSARRGGRGGGGEVPAPVGSARRGARAEAAALAVEAAAGAPSCAGISSPDAAALIALASAGADMDKVAAAVEAELASVPSLAELAPGQRFLANVAIPGATLQTLIEDG
jgi:hypothetical protein